MWEVLTPCATTLKRSTGLLVWRNDAHPNYVCYFTMNFMRCVRNITKAPTAWSRGTRRCPTDKSKWYLCEKFRKSIPLCEATYRAPSPLTTNLTVHVLMVSTVFNCDSFPSPASDAHNITVWPIFHHSVSARNGLQYPCCPSPDPTNLDATRAKLDMAPFPSPKINMLWASFL